MKSAECNNERETLLTTKQLASKLQTTPRAISRLVDLEIIPFYRLKRYLRFSLSEVLESMRNKRSVMNRSSNTAKAN